MPLIGDMEVATRFVAVNEGWSGLTLLEAVRRAFPQLTPREVFKKTRSGEILVDQKRREPTGKVFGGETIAVTLLWPKKPSSKPVEHENLLANTPSGPFRVIREDEDLLVVSKPAGCASHPALGRGGDTLIERVRHYLKVPPADSPEDFRPALANRLDIATSGIVLIGKTPHAQRKLGLHLQKKRIEKRYIALLAGNLETDEGEITDELEVKPDSRDLKRGKILETPKFQSAHTVYKVLARSSMPLQTSLAEIDLKTGRNHQIRRHFSGIGHPVAMDKRYGDRDFNEAFGELTGLWRFFLHAYKVEMDHPVTGERLVIIDPLPEELLKALLVFGIRYGGD